MLCIVADTNYINVLQHLGKCFCDYLKQCIFWDLFSLLKLEIRKQLRKKTF